jgi:sortase B
MLTSIFLLLLCYSGYILIGRGIETYKSNMLKKQMAEIFNGITKSDGSEYSSSEKDFENGYFNRKAILRNYNTNGPLIQITPSPIPAVVREESSEEKFERLSKINKDIKAWIKINNTNIDYPVVQSKDNVYYLERDVNKKYSYTGSIFMDFRCSITDKKCKNIIIYGHNMKNDIMFHELPKFKKSNFFYNANNTIILNMPGGSYKFTAFSAYITDTSFDYLKTTFLSNNEFSEFIKAISERSMFRSNLKLTENDRIITLSTCAYDFDDARFVVHGKLTKMDKK